MKRHIVQVSAYYPPHLGGQEYAVQSLAVQLASAGHKVQVVASSRGSNNGISQESQVEVHRLPSFVFGHAPIMPQFVQRLLRLARSQTIVHVHIGQAFTPEMVWLASRLGSFKYIAHLHIDFQPSGLAGILLPLYKKFILKPVLHHAAYVVVLNDKTKRLVREVYGYKGPLKVMANGIDEMIFAVKRPELPSRPPSILRLLFVGRLSKQKNILALIKALTLTKRKVRLDIVGEGEERSAIELAIRQAGLTNITMHGRLARRDVLPLYAQCNALVMPSLYEAQPLVLLEAMAARIPIIGTDVIGVAEHLKDAGIIVPPTTDGIVQGIEYYFSHYATLPELTERGFKKAQQLSWPKLLGTYERLYETVAGD